MEVAGQIDLELSSDWVTELVLQFGIEYLFLEGVVEGCSEVIIGELDYLLFDVAWSYG